MIELTLKTGEKFPLTATARYFVVRAVGDGVALAVRNAQEVQVQNSDVIDLLGSNEITLVNTSAQPQIIKFQLSPFKIEVGAAKNNIKAIEDIVTVQMDRDVNIGAVNQDGDWHLSSSNKNTHLPVVTCLANQATLIAAADVNRKELRLNIDNEQLGGLFLGGVGIQANQGGFLDVGITEYMPTEGALYAFNNNAESIDISVMSLERV